MRAVGRLSRFLALGAVTALLGIGLAPHEASARAFFSFGIGVPLAPAYVAPPPPVYYPPPPAYYVPPPPAPVYVPTAPAPVYAPTPGQCREYQSTTIIDGRPQQVYGTACLQPDGSWRIVR